MRQGPLIFHANILITVLRSQLQIEKKTKNGHVSNNFSFYFRYCHYLLVLLETGTKVKPKESPENMTCRNKFGTIFSY